MIILADAGDVVVMVVIRMKDIDAVVMAEVDAPVELAEKDAAAMAKIYAAAIIE